MSHRKAGGQARKRSTGPALLAPLHLLTPSCTNIPPGLEDPEMGRGLLKARPLWVEP
jgi:hypothetical protein